MLITLIKQIKILLIHIDGADGVEALNSLVMLHPLLRCNFLIIAVKILQVFVHEKSDIARLASLMIFACFQVSKLLTFSQTVTRPSLHLELLSRCRHLLQLLFLLVHCLHCLNRTLCNLAGSPDQAQIIFYLLDVSGWFFN